MIRSKGFTLIEILVAVAIFGLLSIAAYTVLDSGMRSQQQAETRLEHLAQLQRLFHTLNQDIQYLVPRQTRDDLGDLEAFLGGESDLAGQQFELHLTRSRWRNPADYPRSHLQRVEYRFEDEQVIRKHRVFLDKVSNSPEVDRLIAKDIESIRIQFKDVNGQWQDQWGRFEGQANNLPSAILIQVRSKLLGDIERFYLLTPFAKQQVGPI
jgi:general secretion pathway protein J